MDGSRARREGDANNIGIGLLLSITRNVPFTSIGFIHRVTDTVMTGALHGSEKTYLLQNDNTNGLLRASRATDLIRRGEGISCVS